MVLFGLRWFDSAVQRDVYQWLLLAFLLTEGIILLISARNSGKASEKKKSDAGSRIAIVLGFAVTLEVGSFSNSFSHTLPPFCYWLGCAFLVFGTAFRAWSVWTLRNYFTLSVQVSGEQHIVRSGPYRVLRHPAYTGGILQLIGFPVGLRSFPGLLAAIVIAALIYGYRIRIEERALQERFGEAYRQYSSQTWRLIPFLF